MSIFRLVIKEIMHRKLNFIFALFSIVVAVGLFTGILALLSGYDSATQTILKKKQADLEKRLTTINGDIRKAMLKLGFNIMILPEGQDLGDWYAKDYGSKYMPFEYIDKLAGAGLKTIEHIVPCLTQKIKWPETKWTVILTGVGDKITNPALHEDEIPFDPIPLGKVILGHEIHGALGFTIGGQVTILNHKFTVYKCYPEHGNKDDITVWLNLKDAQELLDKKGQINEIRAMEAECAWSDVSRVREEILKILPGTKIIEESSLASAKTQARTKTLEAGRLSIQEEKNNREAQKKTRIHLALILVPLVLLICTGWLSLLSFRNIQDRRSEIGVLMSLGCTSGQVLRLFIVRAFILAVVGGFSGFLCGGIFGVLDFSLFCLALLISTGITLFGTWWPAMRASHQDPADILRCD